MQSQMIALLLGVVYATFGFVAIIKNVLIEVSSENTTSL